MTSGCPSAHHSYGSCHSNDSPESVSAPRPAREDREGRNDVMSVAGEREIKNSLCNGTTCIINDALYISFLCEDFKKTQPQSNTD